jgi:hypothetical protein
MILGTAKRNKEGDKPLPTRSYSSKQEKAVAKAVGGKVQKNSGATPFAPGDVLTDKANNCNAFLLECKTKTSPSASISIQKAWFEKNRQECLLTGTPHQAVVFNFGPGEENHYIIDEYLFLELLDHLKTLGETL